MTIKGGVHTIREGITNQYVMPATILAFLAAIGFVYIGLLSILIVMAALALFLSVSGIEIDTRLLRYRNYKVIAGISPSNFLSIYQNATVFDHKNAFLSLKMPFYPYFFFSKITYFIFELLKKMTELLQDEFS